MTGRSAIGRKLFAKSAPAFFATSDTTCVPQITGVVFCLPIEDSVLENHGDEIKYVFRKQEEHFRHHHLFLVSTLPLTNFV